MDDNDMRDTIAYSTIDKNTQTLRIRLTNDETIKDNIYHYWIEDDCFFAKSFLKNKRNALTIMPLKNILAIVLEDK